LPLFVAAINNFIEYAISKRIQQHKRAMLLADFDYISGLEQQEAIINERIEIVNNN
jgi:hypothetical protein